MKLLRSFREWICWRRSVLLMGALFFSGSSYLFFQHQGLEVNFAIWPLAFLAAALSCVLVLVRPWHNSIRMISTFMVTFATSGRAIDHFISWTQGESVLLAVLVWGWMAIIHFMLWDTILPPLSMKGKGRWDDRVKQ